MRISKAINTTLHLLIVMAVFASCTKEVKEVKVEEIKPVKEKAIFVLLPEDGRVLRLKDFDNLVYRSKNEFLELCMDEVLEMVPFKAVVIGDREFGTAKGARDFWPGLRCNTQST
ncbi:MAG: hypothetical protein HQL06_17335 [Nitrospirae bacterium]|nr:hypothetical protein [Nitrospirota bacterium]